ncbi:hypothetical protein OHC33_002273 [Knufia fluminis]|uniref:DUF1750-domain-containing protein n=1 Tax=Knufia fluminis TaxID=191047 RepID=A0AAN8EM46_9EURO|nr:hypothetical protein OHC33_002273 [Knufia fluminis]
MDPRQLKDPAAGVPLQLHKYPMLSNPSPDTLVSYLLEAPKVMREVATVQWQFLDAPPDGSIFLTWQPTEYLSNNFASDGYIWSDVEQPINSEVRGYTLQMLWHRAGYRPGAEAMATHSRRRYRLIPNNQMGMANPDPSLWLVHYNKAQPRDQHPAASLPMLPHVTQQFQQRQMIQRSGQLPRKEFMFADRSSWPVIQLPAGLGRSSSSGQLASSHRRGQSLAHEATLEEDEDVSRGDVLDFMTPREISRMRYEQHHEWMEEILESPYATKQIIPSELGLGRKGALESFTNGFFTAPTSTTHDPVNGKVGKLDPGKAEEFTKHANAKLEEMQADIEKMKQQHLRRMEKLRRTTDLGAAERKLRNMNVADDSYKDIAAQVQNLVGRNIEPVAKVACVSRGGMQDIKPVAPEPQQHQQNVNALAQQQAQMQAQQQRQYQQQQGQPQPPQQYQAQQPQQQQQHQAQAQPTLPQQQPQPTQQASLQPQTNAEATPSQPTPAPTDQAPVVTQPPEIPDQEDANIENNDAVDNDDVDMGDLGDQVATGDGSADNGDWDMVNDQQTIQEDQNQTLDQQGSNQTGDQQAQTSDQGQIQQLNQSGNNTPGNDFDMVNDFDANMDTAGDALADYNPDDDLNLDDSAFGDAFHHHQEDMS